MAASLLIGQGATPQKKEESVRPGINEKYLDPELKIDSWLKRFEGESREVFHAKEKVRASKDVFRKEIEDAGLTFIEEVKVEGLKENYFLRFRKN